MKNSLVILLFFIAGIAAGLSGLVPESLIGGDASHWALFALMFCVGISLGNDTKVLRDLKSMDPRLLLLPLMTITGTLAGCAIVSICLPARSVLDCLAVGSGFGYYSLSSIFINEFKGTELGTVALLANIMREIITLLGAPLMARWFGKLAPISAGGATSMDTTLPIIARCCGDDFVILSIFHGFTVDFSVPFLVTLFCNL
ncbi:MAG: lysine exporter LysO family protein [Bacteroidales bacterium]|nr:lysine exporter LysO family protein [Bacteroidales bacterium]